MSSPPTRAHAVASCSPPHPTSVNPAQAIPVRLSPQSPPQSQSQSTHRPAAKLVSLSLPESGSPARTQHGDGDGDGDADDRQTQTQLEQSLKRSVTLVIWYKPNCDPIRLTHELPTFPLFALSQFPSLVSDLALTPTSYVDTFNVTTGYWEQHVLTTVRTVESEQRLLYKLRRSLLAGLADNECVELADELALLSRRAQIQQQQQQPGSPALSSMSVSATPLKRPVSIGAEVSSTKRLFPPDAYSLQPHPHPHPHAVFIPPASYVLPPHTMAMPYGPPLTGASLSQLSSGAGVPGSSNSFHPAVGVGMQSPVVPYTPLYSPGPNTPCMAISPGTRAPFAKASSAPFSSHQHPHPHPHPPPQPQPQLSMKRWPNDYTVSELAAGFRAMDVLAAQTPGMTQRTAFERVFGMRYVKSTVCRHRAVYRRADPAVRTAFEDMGDNEKAVWGEFVKRVEGRTVSGKVSAGEATNGNGAGAVAGDAQAVQRNVREQEASQRNSAGGEQGVSGSHSMGSDVGESVGDAQPIKD